MGWTLTRWRIPVASLVAIALVIGAYMLARGAESPPTAQASEQTALLQALATKDSNGDGLPDWEKVLYGIPIDATTTDYFHLGMTDGEAVAKGLIVPKAIADVPVATSTASAATGQNGLPEVSSGTLTDTFSKNFFTAYLAAKQANNGVALTQDQMTAIVNQVMDGLSQSITSAPDFKTASQLTVSGTGPAALTAFAAAAEGVMRTNGAKLPESELQYLQDALNGDSSAIDNIAILAKSFRNTAAGIAALAVPKELATDDLSLINAMARIGEADNDFTRFSTDPVAAMLALKQYPNAVRTMAQAFQNIRAIYMSEGVTLSDETPGAAFVNVAAKFTSTTTQP